MDSIKTKAAIIITILLLPLAYIVVITVLTGQFSNDIKAMVAGTIIGSMLGSITGFWLGGTHSTTQEKQDVPGK